LESASLLPGKNRYADDQTPVGGFLGSHANH